MLGANRMMMVFRDQFGDARALLAKLSRHVISHRADLLYSGMESVFLDAKLRAPVTKFIVLAQVDPTSILGGFGLVVRHVFLQIGSPLKRGHRCHVRSGDPSHQLSGDGEFSSHKFNKGAPFAFLPAVSMTCYPTYWNYSGLPCIQGCFATIR